MDWPRRKIWTICILNKKFPDSNKELAELVLDEFQKEFLKSGILVMNNGRPVLVETVETEECDNR